MRKPITYDAPGRLGIHTFDWVLVIRLPFWTLVFKGKQYT